MTPGAETPKLDLAAGLVTKLKKVAPKIDLNAGLVSKPKTTLPPVDSPSEAKSHPVSSDAGTAPAARKAQRLRPPAAAVSPRLDQPIHLEFLEKRTEQPAKRIELPAVTPPAVASQETAPPRSPVIPAPAIPAQAIPTPVARVPIVPEQAIPAPAIPELPSIQPVAPLDQPRASEPGDAVQAPRRPVPLPPRGREPQPAAAPPQAPAAPAFHQDAPPAQTWERLSNPPAPIEPEPAPPVLGNPEPEETPYNAATRMSGLKNLIFSLGLKNMHQAENAVEHPFERPPVEPPVERRPVERVPIERPVEIPPAPVEPLRQRPVYPRAHAPIPHNPIRRENENVSPTLVTAPPEFLPPKPMVESTEKERTPSGHSTSRRDRRDTYDDVEILPSWRGQYKKK